ncbi:MAG: hypothetical protein M3361_04170, partial [Candidatus Tectomicrobia bacterium]|nr:hypothetical protein [Candidatus Tectomicrobia bacterium]
VQPHTVADDFGCKPVTGVEINLLVPPGNLPDFSLLGNLTVPDAPWRQNYSILYSIDHGSLRGTGTLV